ncbi:hypothetical protein HDU96_000957, partial [Phlyctochytrium bullatum]
MRNRIGHQFAKGFWSQRLAKASEVSRHISNADLPSLPNNSVLTRLVVVHLLGVLPPPAESSGTSSRSETKGRRSASKGCPGPARAKKTVPRKGKGARPGKGKGKGLSRSQKTPRN